MAAPGNLEKEQVSRMIDCLMSCIYANQVSYSLSIFTIICFQIFGMAEKEMEYRVELFNK